MSNMRSRAGSSRIFQLVLLISLHTPARSEVKLICQP